MQLARRLIGRADAQRADRLTLGLAGVAAGTLVALMGGELARRVRLRSVEAEGAEGVIDTAEQALALAGVGAQDTLTVAREGYGSAPRGETVLFNILTGFAGAFALVRLSTWGIRGGWWPLGNVRLGGRHVHHFVPGILIAFLAGGAGMVSQNERLEEVLAFPFGAGIGLTFDEAALLLQLEDVYWTPEGVLSVQLSLGFTAVLGATIIALRMLRRGERASQEAGLIPDEAGEFPTWRVA